MAGCWDEIIQDSGDGAGSLSRIREQRFGGAAAKTKCGLIASMQCPIRH